MSPKTITLAAVAVVVVGVAGVAGRAAAAPLTIDEAVRQALATSEDAKSAHVRTEQADADVSAARSAFFPTVTLYGSYTRRQREVTRNVGGEDVTIQSHNALGGNVTAAMTLFDGRAYPLLRAARRAREAVALEEKEQRRQVAYAAASSYLAALGQERVVDAAVRRLELAAAREKDVSARVDARLVSSNDRTQAQLEVATATRNVAEARAALALAYADLSWWTGGDVEGPLVEPASLLAAAQQPAPDVGAMTGDAARRRPDLAAARQKIEVAKENATEPGRRAWPTLDLTGQYRVTNEAGLSGNNSDWLVTLSATWELWDGGRRAAEGRARALDVELARIEASAADRKTKNELRAAVARLRGAQEALPPAEDVAAAAARHTDEIGILYGQGLARALDVVNAGAQRFEAEVGLTQARLDLAAAWLELSLAAGMPAPGGEP